MSTGRFITFEGIEGSGKTTQIALLKSYLESQGHQVCVTFEPGGTAFGQQIRKILLDPEHRLQSTDAEIMLFIADRMEHISRVVQPALADGVIVLCDRYVDSTYAYQQGGSRVDPDLVDQLCGLVELVPDLTLVLDILPEEGLRRAKNRAELDRYEQEDLTFHARVREMYLARAAADSARMKVIDVGDESIESVSMSIQDHVRALV